MNIWLVRHGRTKYNDKKLMQGLTDEPLDETGVLQAESAKAAIGDVRFDAVYASPLDRAITTAAIIGGTEKGKVITDERIIEVDFGPYELKQYTHLGFFMTLFWIWPEVVPAPQGVESISSLVERSSSFLSELESKDYENVLVASHGGILRAMNGYLADRKNGIMWRPKMHNCEIRVYESLDGEHSFIKKYESPKVDS